MLFSAVNIQQLETMAIVAKNIKPAPTKIIQIGKIECSFPKCHGTAKPRTLPHATWLKTIIRDKRFPPSVTEI